MNLKIKIFLDSKVIEQNIKYSAPKKISFPVDPANQTVKIEKITLNDIEVNKFYNTSFAIDESDVVLTSIHEITKKGVYTLYIDDLYILSHRSNNWHCSTTKEDFIFAYEFERDSFTNVYRDRDHKGFGKPFIPCFGGSFTYGDHVPNTDAWPHLLSQMTSKNYLNMGVCGIGADGIYNNLKLLHEKYQFAQCLILFPLFERKIVRCKVDNLYLRIPSSVDLTSASSNFHLYTDSRVKDKMAQVQDFIIKDIDNRYSKIFLHKIINYCQRKKIHLSVSSDDRDVYRYLQQQKNIKILAQFPKLSLFTGRASDGRHPYRKHYEHFVKDIVKTL